MLWPTAAKQTDKSHRGVVKTAGGFRAGRHRAEVEKSWVRHANEEAKKKGEKEN